MTHFSKVCACALFGLNFASAADVRWIRMRSPNFEVYGTSGEKSTRETLRYFEQVRDFFAQSVPDKSDDAVPVRIVVFGSMKEYEPYRPNEFAIAYYRATAGKDYIVMSHAGAETFPTAVHEYVHLVLRHEKMDFPPWLNEGLAELYSTLKPLGGKVIVGDIILGRLQALLRDRWVPLSTILAADHNSPYYNEKDKAGSLYNEGWALTHMLSLSAEYRPKFKQVLSAINGGTNSEEALTKVYGKPLASIERDLQAYLRGDRFKAAVFATQLEKVTDQTPAEPVAAFDVTLMLVDLTDQRGNEAQNQKKLEELTRDDPQRPEPYVALAYLALRQNQSEAARADFDKAFALGSRDSGVLWDYARMVESRDAVKSAEALAELLKQQPNRLEVRLELASVQLRSNAAKEALQTLAPVKKVTPEDAPKLLTLLAYANLEAGDRATALTAATQLKTVSKSAEERDRADQLVQFIQSAQSGETKPTLAFTDTDDPPTLKRRDLAPEIPRPVVRRPSFVGKFVELQCGAQATVVLETLEGKKLLIIDDPTKLLVNGKSGETRDLSCGPQKPVQVRIEYDPSGPNHPGIAGLVRALYFDP